MSSTIDIPESSNVSKEKAAIVEAPKKGGWRKGIAIMDFIMRLGAIASALAAAVTMSTADQSLPFYNQFFQFEASYDSFPTFQFFLISMALVAGYLVLSLPFSVILIIRPHAVGARFLLIVLDTVFLTLSASSASASAGIVYLAHNGDQDTNWFAVCNQFGDFCMATSEAVVASFGVVVTFVFLILMSAFALKNGLS